MLTNSYLASFVMKRHPSIIKDILGDIYNIQKIIIFILIITYILDKYTTMGKPR